jgi:hypothetical protein
VGWERGRDVAIDLTITHRASRATEVSESPEAVPGAAREV